MELVRPLTAYEKSTAVSLKRLAHQDYKALLNSGLAGNDPRVSSYTRDMAHVKETLDSHYRLSKQPKDQASLKGKYPEQTQTVKSIRNMINQAYQERDREPGSGRGR